MSSPRVFDVMVVYTSAVALSPKQAGGTNLAPFTAASGRQSYNVAYGYFLATCVKLGLRAAFCTSSDIIGPGACDSYWLFEKGHWSSVIGQCYARQVFDKFSPVTHKKKLERALLFSSDDIQPFNHPELAALFFDKLETYESLSEFSIPTVSIAGDSEHEVEISLKTLQLLVSKHVHASDFSSSVVLKDRFGAGGNRIYKVSDNFSRRIYDLMQTHPTSSFVLQPFMNFASGYAFENRRTNTDIRLIYHHGAIIQTYVRMAKKGDFRCNEHQGGELVYTALSDIPPKVLQFSRRVVKAIWDNSSLFALDYIVSDNGNVFFLEGNIGPGIDWNLSKKKNEIMSKRLIKSIVGEMATRRDALRELVLHSPIDTSKHTAQFVA